MQLKMTDCDHACFRIQHSLTELSELIANNEKNADVLITAIQSLEAVLENLEVGLESTETWEQTASLAWLRCYALDLHNIAENCLDKRFWLG
jgi:hypothetical protein